MNYVFFKIIFFLILLVQLTSNEYFFPYLTPVPIHQPTSGVEGIDQIYVINLDRQRERWNRIEDLFDRYGIFPTRVSAVDGWSIPKKIQRDLQGKKRYTPNLTPGMIGCSLSHQKIWKNAYDQGLGVIWVVEDDVIFKDHPHKLSELIQSLSEIDAEWDILYTDPNTVDWDGNYVEGCSLTKPPKYLNLSNEDMGKREVINDTFESIKSRHGMYSMIISKRGIKKLYEFHLPMDIWAPVDNTIHYTPGIRQYILRNAIVTHTIDGRSSDTHSLNFVK